ncbi:hypothetical protein [Flavobacterium facile]|uniref:hypothetical protein n=1 Tax=Flavobacterium facile TaxID=2893174 RepID=UPI002E782D84|nr:hypothetical protein [Flavobacterium sp. T-12]
MKKFVNYILKLALLLIISASFLDFCYTKIYEVSVPRSKFQKLRTLKHEKIDYLFLGSSRVDNSVVINSIEKKTNKSAYNLGFQASKLQDIYLILQLLKKYEVSYDKVLIQVDFAFNNELEFSNVLFFEALPFIKENKLIEDYVKHNKPNDFWKYRYLPFYKFIISNPKNGFREVVANVIKTPTRTLQNKGYSPLYGEFKNNKLLKLPSKINNKNIYYNLILNYCIKNKINVVFYTAPCKITKNSVYFDELGRKVTNLNDFSDLLKDDIYFYDNFHINNDGATIFTNVLIEKLKL